MIQLAFSLPAQADQWGSVVLAHCYDLDDTRYQEHFFVRVFWTELGGGQLYTETLSQGAPLRLRSLNQQPATCLINGKKVVFETVDYRSPTLRGACGLCEQTGFRITVDEDVVWEAQRPVNRGDPIFNGTLDMDRDMLRVCEETPPEALGVEPPFEQDFFSAHTNILICETTNY